MAVSKYPSGLIKTLKGMREEIDAAIEQIDKDHDKEYERLKWVEKDFAPVDCAYYLLIKLKEQEHNEGRWSMDVSDGWSRTGSSASSLEEIKIRAFDEAKEKMKHIFSKELRLDGKQSS